MFIVPLQWQSYLRWQLHVPCRLSSKHFHFRLQPASHSLCVSVAQTIILVPSHRLRIMALPSSGCRKTVEGLSNVQSSSTTQQWQSYRAGWRAVSAEFKAFHFRSIKSYSVIPLFRYSVFRVLQHPPKMMYDCL